MAEVKVGRAAAFTIPMVTLFVLAVLGASYLIAAMLGLPFSIDLPVVVRAFGGVVLAAGFAVMVWLFENRGASNVIVSTYVSFVKSFRRTPLAESSGRTEAFVVGGPQKYVRHPLYFGVVVMVIGWALLTARTFVFISTVIFLAWFRLVVIPFEERELRALFGEEYRRYAEETPTFVPFTKRRRRRD